MKNIQRLGMIFILFLTGLSPSLSAHEGWYIGASTGVDRVEMDRTFSGTLSATDTIITDETQIDNLGLLVNAGYRLNDFIAFNLDYTSNKAQTQLYYRTDTGDFNTSSFDAKSHYLIPSVHLIYPVTHTFNLYAKAGFAIVGSTWNSSDKEETFNATDGNFTVSTTSAKGNDWSISPSFGLGGQWAFYEGWQATIEYLYTKSEFNPQEDTSVLSYKNQSLLIGLRYLFN
ncbi:outer membrane beta-barrel protein [Sulfurimonas sp. MAG313]|nr:outer membrane beta-barrel protein [Sulfurimonas sp. MAG313]MDF1879749.1 outer membrane beta-barrel protein [Sulfurimonas sp. MAG313]